MTMNTSKVTVFEGNKDSGWLGANQNWWFDQSFPHSYSVFDLNSFYEENYFKQDHVPPQVVKRYVNHVLDYARRFLGREVRSVLELGCGGGWFTEEFIKRGVEIFAVEGTRVGHERALKRGVPPNVLLRHDLRNPLSLNRTFDIVVCTEVAEHIECPFSSQLVHNIVSHGRLVWFSFEEPNTNEAHYHHCNEQPEKFWVNLFRFNGFEPFRLPEDVTRACEARGDFIFYSSDLPLPPGLDLKAEETRTSTASLGSVANRDLPAQRLKATIKQFVPPILWEALRKLRPAQ
jgi:SAM-dependent methyltransferase